MARLVALLLGLGGLAGTWWVWWLVAYKHIPLEPRWWIETYLEPWLILLTSIFVSIVAWEEFQRLRKPRGPL